jgi:hypothetical protein
MRAHIQRGMANTLVRLEPYFRLRKKYAGSYSRTPKTQLPIASSGASSGSSASQ